MQGNEDGHKWNGRRKIVCYFSRLLSFDSDKEAHILSDHSKFTSREMLIYIYMHYSSHWKFTYATIHVTTTIPIAKAPKRPWTKPYWCAVPKVRKLISHHPKEFSKANDPHTGQQRWDAFVFYQLHVPLVPPHDAFVYINKLSYKGEGPSTVILVRVVPSRTQWKMETWMRENRKKEITEPINLFLETSEIQKEWEKRL